VRALFAQPRKTIINNLVQATQQKKESILEKLSLLNIASGLRPQDLNIKTITDIAKSFFKIA
jgi:16S rRNA A1518/A1519 N6-dimethyltransferase RsmA/KsgA/DIM1 with predicted DNA glycosylase/AP lyase activity